MVKHDEGRDAKDFLIVDMQKDADHNDMAMVWHLNDNIIVKCDLIVDNSQNEGDLEGEYRYLEDINALTDEWNSLKDTFTEQQRARETLES